MDFFGFSFLYSPLPMHATDHVIAFTIVFLVYFLPIWYRWIKRVLPLIDRRIVGAYIVRFFYVALLLTLEAAYIFGFGFLYSPVPTPQIAQVAALTSVFLAFFLPMFYRWSRRVLPQIARRIRSSVTWTLGGAYIYGFFYVALLTTAIHFLVKFKH